MLSAKCDHGSIYYKWGFSVGANGNPSFVCQPLRTDTIKKKRDMMKTVSVDLCRIYKLQSMVLVCSECYLRRTCPPILATEMIRMRLQSCTLRLILLSGIIVG